MAPKPPPAAAAAAAKNAPKAPPRKPGKLEICFSSYNCVTLGILMVFSLLLYTIWYMSLCAIEKAKHDPVRKAVAQIKRFLISQDAKYGDLNDTDLILAAEEMARQLLPWAEKINEIQAEIADLHYKLNTDWKAHNSHLYLFNTDTLDFEETKKLCNESGGFVVEILDLNEEVFIEEVLRRKHDSYYIALTYSDRQWKWNGSVTRPFRTYWKKYHPWKLSENKCATIESGCTNKLACWASVHCSSKERGICKKKPQDKWMI